MGFLHKSLKNKFPVSWDVNLEARSHSVSPGYRGSHPLHSSGMQLSLCWDCCRVNELTFRAAVYGERCSGT